MLEKTISRVMNGVRTPEGKVIAILLVVCLSLMTWNVGALSYAVNGEAAKAAEEKAVKESEEQKEKALEAAQDSPPVESAKQTKDEAELEQRLAEEKEAEEQKKKEAEKKRKAQEKAAEAEAKSSNSEVAEPAEEKVSTSDAEQATPDADEASGELVSQSDEGEDAASLSEDETAQSTNSDGQRDYVESEPEPEAEGEAEPETEPEIVESPSQQEETDESSSEPEATVVVSSGEDDDSDEEVPMPACKFSERANGVAVKVSAPAGAFPKGTTMTVDSVAAAQVIDAVEGVIDGDAVTIRAIGIEFNDVDGNRVDPKVDVSVTLKAADIAAASGNDERAVALVGVSADGDAALVEYETKKKSPNAIAFEGKPVYSYAIVVLEPGGAEEPVQTEGNVEEGTTNHLTYRYFLTDAQGTTYEYRVDGKPATQTVEEGDVLVEPQPPSTGDFEEFSGWYIEDTNEPLEFGTVGKVERDATIEVVGDIDKVFHVTLMSGGKSDAGDGEVLASLRAQAEKGENTAKVSLGDIVAAPPTDDERFLGWASQEASYTVEFAAGSEIQLSEDIVLYPVFERAPWLRFDGNGTEEGDVSYTAPQRVPQGTAPIKPSDPKRVGYEFEGWFTQADGGDEFVFDENARIEESTTLFAHWRQVEVPYTIVFWRQKASDDKEARNAEKAYDYVESSLRSALAGDAAALTDEDRAKGYEGFHFNEAASDEGAMVSGDGSTVVNVYYDRDLITMTFEGGKEPMTFTGLYGQPLDKYGYSWPAGTWKHADRDIAYLGQFVLPGDDGYSTSMTFTSAGDAAGTVNFYLQKADGSYPDSPSGQGGLSAESGSYTLFNGYDGFEVEGYQNRNSSNSGQSGDWSEAKAGDEVTYESPLGVGLKRKSYAIDFQNGSDGSIGSTPVLYGTPLADMEIPAITTYPDSASEASKYEFAGWFADPECTVHVSFGKEASDKEKARLQKSWNVRDFVTYETMPAENFTVYAGWMKRSFDVTVDVNGGTLPAGAQESLQVPYGDKVEDGLLAQATRPGYALVGWSVDGDDDSLWDFSTGVTSDLRLVAVWVSETGVAVYYDAGLGDDAPLDEKTYAEGSTVTVAREPNSPTGKSFVGWRLQKADGGTVGMYNPGQSFKISSDCVVAGQKGAHVLLVAEYTTDESTTVVAYSANGGDGSIDSQTLPVNAASRLSDGAGLSREGYTLIGWSFEPGEDNRVNFRLGGAIAADKVSEEENALYAVWAENVSIIASGVEGTSFAYDGTRKVNDDPVMIYEVRGKEADELPDGVSYTLVGKAAGVNAGTYNDELTITLGSFDANRYHVTTTVHNGSMRIVRPAVTVTVEGTRSTVPFDGTEHTASGFEVTADNPAFDVSSDLLFTGEARASRTDAGTTSMGLSADQFALAESSNFELADIKVVDGYQTIEPARVNVKVIGNIATVGFTGKDQEVEGYSLVSGNSLYDAQENVSFKGAAVARSSQSGTTPMGLSADQFSNSNPNFEVAFDVVDGRLVVAPPDGVVVTVKGNSAQSVYTGEEHTASGFEIQTSDPSYTEECFSFTGTSEAARTDAGTTPMGLSADQFQNTDSRFDNVAFDVIDGYVEVTQAQATVTVRGSRPDAAVYDRQVHEAAGYTVESSSPAFVVERDLATQISPEEARVAHVDAGVYAMGLSAAQFTNKNSANVNVTFVIEDGRLVITPVTEQVTVKVTGRKDRVPYDKVEHSVSGYDVESSNELYLVGDGSEAVDFLYGGSACVKETNAGTYAMGLVHNEFANSNPNFTNVVFEVEDGELVIEKAMVDVNVKGHYAEKTYNGAEQHVQGYDVSVNNDLYTEEDFSFNGTAAAQGTNAGSYFMGLTRDRFVNVNENFNVTFSIEDGFLVVSPVEEEVHVTVVGESVERTYNGAEQTVEGYNVVEVSNPLYRESYFDFSGDAVVSARNAGEYTMGLSADQFANKSKNFSNIVFDVKDGMLAINPLDVKVRITGAHDCATGDGEEHAVSGYTFDADTPLYNEGDFTFTGTASAARTDAGTTAMGLSADQFANANQNFGTVTFEVEDGYQTIAAEGEVIVTITGHRDLLSFDAQSHSVAGYDVETSDPRYTEQDFEFDGRAHAEATGAGFAAMNLDAAQFRNVNDAYENVTFNVVDGGLEITPVAVVVTIEGNSDTCGFDAALHEVVGYAATADVNEGLADNATPIYDTDLNVQLDGQARAERQFVGTSYMGLAASDFTSADTNNFSSVTFRVTDGYLTIEPVPVKITVTGNSSTVPFDGDEHVVEGYSIVADVNEGLAEDAVPVFDLANVRVSGEARAARTDAGTSHMGLSPDQFSSSDVNNFSSVEFEVVDGFQKIDPIDVRVSVVGDANTADYDGGEHVVSGYEVTTSSPLYSTDDFEFTGVAVARQTNAGTAYMNLDQAQFANKSGNFSSVEFDVADGYQAVRPIDAVVTVTGATEVSSYDGAIHEALGYTAVADVNKPAGDGSGGVERMIYDTVNDIKFAGEGAARRQAAGTTMMGLDPSQFANKNANFRSVTFRVIDGYVTIAPAGRVVVAITGNRASAVYDTQEHVASGYSIKSSDPRFTEDMIAFDGTAEARATDAGVTAMGLSAEQFSSKAESEFPDVEFVVSDGSIEITKAQVIVSITGNQGTSVHYDGERHEVTGYKVSASNGIFETNRDLEAKVASDDARAGGIDAGTYAMGLTSSYFTNRNAANVDTMFVVRDGGLTILPVDETVVVTVKGNEQVKTYDGAEHSVSGFTATSSNPLYHPQAIASDNGQAEPAQAADCSYIGRQAAKGKDAGTYAMGLEANQFENHNANFANVEFKVRDGSLTIVPAKVNVTIEGDVVHRAYTGDVQEAAGYRVVANNELYAEDDFTFIGSGVARGKDVRPAPYAMGLDADQFVNTNENFDASFAVTDGQLVIDPIDVQVVVVGHRDGARHDGTEHVVEGYDFKASTPLFSESDIAFTGVARAALVDKGTAYMGLSAEQFACASANFGNVEFDVDDGYQTVVAEDGVVARITGNVGSAVYDGKEHVVSGYDFESSDERYTASDFEFAGEANAARTDAGVSHMGLAPDQFANTNDAFSDVAFVVTDGYQEVTKAPVNVKIEGTRNTVGYDGEEHGVSGFSILADNALYRVDGNEADYLYRPVNGGSDGEGQPAIARTNVGTTKMGLRVTDFANANDNFGPVVFAVEDGYQTVTPAIAHVAITGHANEVAYDGAQHEVFGYDVRINAPLYEESDFGFSGQAFAVRADAGTTYMGLDADQFVNRNPNFGAVSFDVVDGYQAVGKLHATVRVTGSHETVPYDGKRHIVSGFISEVDADASDAHAVELLDVVNDIAFKGASRASRSAEGTTNMELSPDLFSCRNPNFEDVVFEVTDGYIAITAPALTAGAV